MNNACREIVEILRIIMLKILGLLFESDRMMIVAVAGWGLGSLVLFVGAPALGKEQRREAASRRTGPRCSSAAGGRQPRAGSSQGLCGKLEGVGLGGTVCV